MAIGGRVNSQWLQAPEGRSYWNETTRAKQEKLGMSCAALRYQRLLADR